MNTGRATFPGKKELGYCQTPAGPHISKYLQPVKYFSRVTFPTNCLSASRLRASCSWLHMLYKGKTYLRISPLSPPPITLESTGNKIHCPGRHLDPFILRNIRNTNKIQLPPPVPNTAKFVEI